MPDPFEAQMRQHGPRDTVAADANPEDIVALVRADHACIRLMFWELRAAEGRPARLSSLWADLAETLVAHFAAAEEVCYFPFLDGAPSRTRTIRELTAHKEDCLEAIADARLREAGSRLWRLAVRASQDAARQHIATVESEILPGLDREVLGQTSRALASQWRRFMSDYRKDRP